MVEKKSDSDCVTIALYPSFLLNNQGVLNS